MNDSIQSAILTHPFFVGMATADLQAAAAGAEVITFAPGQILFRAGEFADKFYLIRHGSIVLEAPASGGSTVWVQTLAGGDVLGWSWLFPPFVWHFQARAVEATEAIMLDGSHLLVTAETDHHFGYELMKRVAQVVIQRLQATRGQLLAGEHGLSLQDLGQSAQIHKSEYAHRG